MLASVRATLGAFKGFFWVGILLGVHGCQLNTSLVANQNRAPIDHKNCTVASEGFASAVCGQLDLVSQTLTINATADAPEVLAALKEVIDVQVPDVDQATVAYHWSRNVLQQDLRGNLKDTKQCREKMAVTYLPLCRKDNCLLSCDARQRRHYQVAAAAKQSQQTCLANFRSSCLVQCRMGSGMEKHTECNKQCFIKNNASWQNHCDATIKVQPGLSALEIDHSHAHCIRQCSG